MKIASIVARYLLGLIFFVFGLNGFLQFIPVPPGLPQPIVTFTQLLMSTHYIYLTAGCQVLAGALLLINRYVPFALVMLAAIIVNILTVHITMFPQTLVPMPILVVILWFLVAWPLRANFAGILAAKA
ncbi:MAG TPA: DoxX family membrane protein [Candidatus Tumulicola sp.]